MILNNSVNLEITPKYDRSKLPRSIVHIGMGNFHRAHQAYYLHELTKFTNQQDWGICGVEIRPNPAMQAHFKNQDTLYSLIMRSADAVETTVVGSVIDYIYAADDTSLAVQQMCSEETRIVSLTVTENGYNQDKRTGKLNLNHPEIVHDLENATHPKTAIGVITRALQQRKLKNLKPFTVMSCDNLSENGDMARNCVLAFAEIIDSDLAIWISQNVTFPNSMVDRITPVANPKNEQYLLDSYNLVDKLPVMAEDYIQWVIEDKFCNGRPEWQKLNAARPKYFNISINQNWQLCQPYELIKLRILNAGHFALSYPAAFRGIRKVDQAMADPELEHIVSAYQDSIMPSLIDDKNVRQVFHIDENGKCEYIENYKKTILKRFKEPFLNVRGA